MSTKKAFYYDDDVAEFLEGYRKRTGTSGSHVINKLAKMFMNLTAEQQREFAETGKMPKGTK